mgnify:CR=1 FL=1
MAPLPSVTLPAMLLLLATLVAGAVASYFLSFWSGRKAAQQMPEAWDDNESEDYWRQVEFLDDTMHARYKGTERGCPWTQTTDEVEVTVSVPADIQRQQVDCKFFSTHLRLAVRGEVRQEGPFYRKVQFDQCHWALEGAGESRVLKVTLVKAAKTKGTQHWKTLFVPLVSLTETPGVV